MDSGDDVDGANVDGAGGDADEVRADAGGAGADADAAADAFALVGNEHRVAILRALLDAHADDATPYPTPFAALRERAGVEVSAQFAYHLDALVGPFVARTDEGYRLRYAGWKAAAALAAGTYTRQPAFGPASVDGACPHCGAGALHASYGDAWLTVACHGCERVLTRYPFPPGAALAHLDDGGVDALLGAFDDRVRSHFALAVDGVCPECAGPTATGLARTALDPTAADDQNATRGSGHAVQAVADCQQCGNHLTLPVGCVLLAAPHALALAGDRGVDLVDRPYWRVPELVADDRVAVIAEDPLEVAVALGDASANDDAADVVAVTNDLAVERPGDD